MQDVAVLVTTKYFYHAQVHHLAELLYHVRIFPGKVHWTLKLVTSQTPHDGFKRKVNTLGPVALNLRNKAIVTLPRFSIIAI